MANNKQIKRGQVWWWRPTDTRKGHLQNGDRPVIIVSNNLCNYHSEVVHVCPCTTSIKKAYPIQVPVILNGQVNIVLADQLTPVNINELDNMFYQLEGYVMDRVDQAIKWQLGLQPLPNSNSETHFESNGKIQIEPPVVFKDTKTRHKWSELEITKFITNYESTDINAVCEKYGITPATAKLYYAKFVKARCAKFKEVKKCL